MEIKNLTYLIPLGVVAKGLKLLKLSRQKEFLLKPKPWFGITKPSATINYKKSNAFLQRSTHIV